MTWRLLFALLAAFTAFHLALAIEAHAGTSAAAPTPIVWPDSPCNLDHRMDIAIVGGLFFECTCVRLMVGYQCDWYIVAGVPASKKIRSARRITRIKGGLLYTPRVRPVAA